MMIIFCRWYDVGMYDVSFRIGGFNGFICSECEFIYGVNNGFKIVIDFCGNLFFMYGEIFLNYWF